MSDPLSFLGFTYAEVEAADKIVSTKRERDGRICICGHAVRRHSDEFGVVLCKPSRMECKCKKVRAILTAQDVRPFLRKTEGGGVLHALSQGVRAAIDAGVEIEWLIEQKCDRCGTAGPVAPTPITQNGVVMNEATGFDAMLCVQCRVGSAPSV